MKIVYIAAAVFVMASCNNNSGSTEENNDTSTTIRSSTNDTSYHTGNDTNGMNTNGMNNGNASLNDMDREFILKASMGNKAEVEAGRLATDKSSNRDIKDFGTMMVREHGDAQQQLQTILTSLAQTSPDSVDTEHANLKKQLSALSGDKFDQAYIQSQVKDHRQTISLFEKQIASGGNAALKQFASTMLPHIKMHLERAEKLQKK